MSRRKSEDGSVDKSIVTLADVAKAAGVTPMTVSRALKNSNHVSRATRERILAVVDELNYTVNTAARTLATGRTGVIAVICGSPEPIYYSNMVRLFEAQLSQSGFEMRLLHTKSDVRDLINATKASAVDGVLASWMHDLSEEPHFRNSQFFKRCVFLDTFHHPNSDYVRIDLQDSVRRALEHMIDLGRKRIAYVGTSTDTAIAAADFDPAWAIEDRLRTYVSVMQKTGRRYEYINSHVQLSQSERIGRLGEYFKTHGCPDGILCLRDEIAMLVFRALRDCGYRVPEDTVLLGCDGLQVMECFDPPLSSVVQPLEEACALAWNFLQARISSPDMPLQQTSLRAGLALRGSMKPEGWEAIVQNEDGLTQTSEVEKEIPDQLSDAQWKKVMPLVCARAGRKAQIDRRRVLNAILFVQRTGCQWRQLPPEFPNWSTVYSCYHRWESSGVLNSVFLMLGLGDNTLSESKSH